MEINKTDLTAILARFNPWWTGELVKNLPEWKRAVFNELFRWIFTPPAPGQYFFLGRGKWVKPPC